MTVSTFSYTGAAQTWVVPTGVTSVQVEASGGAGGAGGSNAGNPLGGYAKGTITVTPGESIQVNVGGAGGDGTNSVEGAAGWNGGGAGGDSSASIGAGGGGGGGSDVRRGGTALSNRSIVGGGGGGNGGDAYDYDGGAGGDSTGENGKASHYWSGTRADGAKGGSQAAGGALETSAYAGATVGSLGTGGVGGTEQRGGGGGGGGYYGGAGGAGYGGSGGGGGGGGGSNLVTGTSTVSTRGTRAGNGEVVLTYILTPPTNITPTAASTVTTDIPTLSATLPADNTELVTATWQIATDSAFTVNLRTVSEPPAAAKASGVATMAVPTADQLFTGSWFIRARVTDAYANSSAWSATNAFTVSHAPSTTSHAPTGGQGRAFGASGDVTLSWVFSDSSPTDTQTAYQVIVERNDTNALVVDTGKVISTGGTAVVTIPAIQKDQPLRWKIRVYDSDDVVGAYSVNQLFRVSDAPVGNITSPTAAQVVTTPAPTVTWTFTASAGRTQASYRIRVLNGATVAYDSGTVISAALTHTLPNNTLANSAAYTVELTVTDNVDIPSVPHTVAFTTAWTTPAAPAFTVTI